MPTLPLSVLAVLMPFTCVFTPSTFAQFGFYLRVRSSPQDNERSPHACGLWVWKVNLTSPLTTAS